MKKFVRTIFLTLVSLLMSRVGFAQSTLDQKVNELAQQIIVGGAFSQATKTKIAVVDFLSDDSCLDRLRSYLRREIASPLFASKKFTILEREFIDKIIEQNKIELKQAFNLDTRTKLGELLGADVLLIGMTTSLGRDLPVRVKARCYNARTGEQIADATINIPRVEQFKTLLDDCAAGDGGKLGSLRQGEAVKIVPDGGKPGPSRQSEAVKIVPNSVEIELFKCRRDVNTVICQMRLTNKDSTKPAGRVHFSNGALMDEFSNVARLKQVLRDGRRVGYFNIVSGGAVEVELRFEGASLKANKASVIELAINGGKVTYTNICLVGFCGDAR
jgi:hypothetical protein